MEKGALEMIAILFGVIGAGFVGGAVLLGLLMRAREMNVQERQAWFMLGIFGLTMAGYLLLTVVLRFPWHPSTAIWGLFGFTGLTGLIGRRERREGRTVADERDRDIASKATLAGYGVFWLTFVLGCMTPFLIKGPNASVTLTTDILALPVFIGMMIVFTVRSLVTVILYRRQAHGQAA